MHKEELIKFWKSSASRSGSRNFWRILQHCKMGHFSIIWLISSERVIGCSCRLYHRCILGYLDTDSGSRPHSRWRTYAVTDCCCCIICHATDKLTDFSVLWRLLLLFLDDVHTHACKMTVANVAYDYTPFVLRPLSCFVTVWDFNFVVVGCLLSGCWLP